MLTPRLMRKFEKELNDKRKELHKLTGGDDTRDEWSEYDDMSDTFCELAYSDRVYSDMDMTLA